MPHIITTLAHREQPDGSPREHGRHIQSRAVATPEEASDHADDIVYRVYDGARRPGDEMPAAYFEHSTQARDLPESGGTVGPLADGSVIEVRRVR